MRVSEALHLYACYLADCTDRDGDAPEDGATVVGLRFQRGYFIPDESGHVTAGTMEQAIAEAEAAETDDDCGCDEYGAYLDLDDEDLDDLDFLFDEAVDRDLDYEDARRAAQAAGFTIIILD